MANEKKLGLFSSICVCIGLIVASSCLLSLGHGMGLAGGWFVLSIFIVCVLNLTVALSFSELHSLMPYIEGGMGQYTKVGLGPVVSIISNGSAYVIVNLLAPSVEISVCSLTVNQVFLPQVPVRLIGIVFTVLLVVVNYLGIDVFAKVQNFVVGALILSLISLGIISFFKLGTGAPVNKAMEAIPKNGNFHDSLSLTALAFWIFIGVEYIIPVTKNLKNPSRDVPLAMCIGVLLLFAIQSTLGMGMTNYVQYSVLATNQLPHIVFAGNLLGGAGRLWMGIITILAGVSTANTVFGTIPAVMAGMAKNDMLPKIFEKKNRYNVNVAGLFLISGVIIVLLLSGFTESAGLINMLLAASCFWLTSYILVSVTVLVLRRRYPNHPMRNKKLVLWGIPQYLCIIGDAYMLWHISDGAARIFIYKIYGVLFLILAVFAVIWVGLIKKQRMFPGVDIEEVLKAS